MAEIFPGYTTERLIEVPGKLGFAWQITGPRGNTWKLMRNRVNPDMLFPIPENILTGSSQVRGVKWFTDRSGDLKPLE